MTDRHPQKLCALTALVLVCAGAPRRAEAQVGQSGAIATRSDVKMSIEGDPGTSGKKLEALAKGLDKPLSELKRCYGELVKTNPEVTGTLEVELSLPEGKKAKTAEIKLGSNEKLNRPMRSCVSRSFDTFDGTQVPRPAKATVLLELTNSAAGSVSDVRAREQAASHVDVQADPAGGFFAEGKSMQGELGFRVASKSRELVEEAHGAVRATFPALFDCRRRAGKKGSPEGELKIKATLPKGGHQIEVTSCTVAAPNAEPCVTRALKEGLAKVHGPSVQLTIRFHP